MLLPAPRAMSGWVASRCALESRISTLEQQIKKPLSENVQTDLSVVRKVGKACAQLRHIIGAGPLRLELNIRNRIVALQARKDERDADFVALRKIYFQLLKSYQVEQQVNPECDTITVNRAESYHRSRLGVYPLFVLNCVMLASACMPTSPMMKP